MRLADLLTEAQRQMVICNACRYCEGYCAVFPALTLRKVFTRKDLVYLANLCFDCRDCFYACPYGPPHEFAVNVPKIFAELRIETYREYASPPVVTRLFHRNGLAVGLAAMVAVAITLLLVLALRGPSALFAAHVGQGAFYAVIPLTTMTLSAGALACYALGVLLIGLVRFWRDSRGPLRELIDGHALRRATGDALGLRYLRGGGAGCGYPGAQLSHGRRRFHHLVVYGFLLDLASTTVAAIYTHLLDWPAPYPLDSLPVVLGILGGGMLLIGTGVLLCLKRESDRDPADRAMFGMDVGFLVLLFVTSLTGLLLLALRETPVMGTLLAVHLGAVAGLFLTLPYGKFAHASFRYAALVQYAIEQRQNGGDALRPTPTRPASSSREPG